MPTVNVTRKNSVTGERISTYVVVGKYGTDKYDERNE